GDILTGTEPEDLLKFGLIPEFIGRLPVIATLSDLDEAALIDILTRPKNALVKQFQRLFEMEDIGLEVTEDVLHDSMFELPGSEDVEKVVINKDVVEGKAKPIHVHGDKREKAAAGGNGA